MYVRNTLVNRLVKLAQEKSVVRWTDRLDMTIAVDWDIKPKTKQNKRRPGHGTLMKKDKYRDKKGTYTQIWQLKVTFLVFWHLQIIEQTSLHIHRVFTAGKHKI